MKIRHDPVGDLIELTIKDKEGMLRKTDSPFVMEKMDSENNVIRFSIHKVSTLKKQGQSIELVNKPEPAWTDFKLWYEIKGCIPKEVRTDQMPLSPLLQKGETTASPFNKGRLRGISRESGRRQHAKDR